MTCSSCGDLKGHPFILASLCKLSMSAKGGCRGCNLLATGLRLFTKGSGCEGLWHNGYFHLYKFKEGSPLVVHISRGNMWEGVQFVQFYVPPGGKTPWPRFGQGIDLREVLNLDDSVERIREWLHHCGEQHQACHKSSTSELPNRLVEVGDVGADRVHLRTITSASKSPYTALSYCWGDPEGNMKTTKGNVGLYEDEGIQLSLIPHTIRDAINITRELAIPYIWVDALCIIQDDNDDWEKEAQKMRHVYADAYLVISATRSASANQGIFGLRKAVSSDLGYCIKQVPDSFTVERLQLDVDGNSAFSPIHVREELNHALAFREPSDCNAHPLLNRAWAFQERVLATRVVHFGASEIIWNCQESTRCECQTATLEDSGHPFHPTSIRSSEKSGFWWQLLITEYTSLSLTYVKDKLAALEGISQRCEGPRLGKYCFGLWENYILYHMLWRSITSRLSPIPDEQKDVFLGPSWSWVSTHHPVSFDWHHMCFNPTLKAELKGGLPTHDPVDIVLDPRRPLAPLFPFQPSWRLTLKARVRDAVFEIESCSPPDCRYRLHLQPLSVDAEIDQADFFPDFVLCPNHASHDSLMARSKWLEDKDTVQCVLLQDGEEFYADVEQSGYAWKALVVKPIDNDSGVFRRVGIATSNLESRPDEKRPMSSRTISPWNTDEREITLV